MGPIDLIRRFLGREKRSDSSAGEYANTSFRSFFDDSPCPMWVWDPATLHFTDVNSALVKQYGYTKKEFEAMSLSDILVDDLQHKYPDGQPDQQKGPSSNVGRNFHRKKNGSVFSVHVYSQHIHYDGNSAILEFVINDEARASAEAASKALNADLENILESISDGFFTLDKEWNFTYVNRTYLDLYRSSKEDFIGSNFWERFPTASTQRFYTEYERAVKDRVTVHFEEYSSYLDKWISVSAYPTSTGLTVYFTDITEQRRHRLKIEAQNNMLKEIAWIQSHKVRGPVASILGSIDLLFEEKTNVDEVRVILDGIRSKAEELDRIIREINDKTIGDG